MKTLFLIKFRLFYNDIQNFSGHIDFFDNVFTFYSRSDLFIGFCGRRSERFALHGFGRVGVEGLVGQIAAQILVIALRADHGGIVSAEG